MTTDQFATAADLGLMVGFPPPPDKRVGRSNALMTPPYNRWAYQHMRTIYPSAGIATADVPATLEVDLEGGIDRLDIPGPDPASVPELEGHCRILRWILPGS